MSVLLSDGRPLFWHLYPPYPYKESRRRKRLLAWAHIPTEPYNFHVMDETGESELIICDDKLYDRLKLHARREGRAIYTSRMHGSQVAIQLLEGAARDKDATILYSPKTNVRGVKWVGRGNYKSGAVLSSACWYRDDVFETPRWMRTVRKVLDMVGAGDYDTVGALGEATLRRFWTRSGEPHMWRQPDSLVREIRRYTIGGMAVTYADPSHIYPYAYEYDMSSAYPTAVARGLPYGDPCWYWRESEALPRRHNKVLFGVWRIRIQGYIPWSPIPIRDWDRPRESDARWRLNGGEFFTYAGWAQEVEALLETGQATAEFMYGWSWSRLTSFLEPWVDELTGYRERCEDEGDREAARLFKMIVNAAIGRWGMDGVSWNIVPDEEMALSLHDGALPMELSQDWTDDAPLTSLWVERLEEEVPKTRPYHWVSWVRMDVRMELWRQFMHEVQCGNKVISANFDGLYLVDEPHLREGCGRRPFVWRRKGLSEFNVPYNRGVLSIEKFALPGMSGAMRMSILVDHQRRNGRG